MATATALQNKGAILKPDTRNVMNTVWLPAVDAHTVPDCFSENDVIFSGDVDLPTDRQSHPGGEYAFYFLDEFVADQQIAAHQLRLDVNAGNAALQQGLIEREHCVEIAQIADLIARTEAGDKRTGLSKRCYDRLLCYTDNGDEEKSVTPVLVYYDLAVYDRWIVHPAAFNAHKWLLSFGTNSQKAELAAGSLRVLFNWETA